MKYKIDGKLYGLLDGAKKSKEITDNHLRELGYDVDQEGFHEKRMLMQRMGGGVTYYSVDNLFVMKVQCHKIDDNIIEVARELLVTKEEIEEHKKRGSKQNIVMSSIYLVTDNANPPFLTQWFDPENHFNPDVGMVVYNTKNWTYTTDGYTWHEIEEDHL